MPAFYQIDVELFGAGIRFCQYHRRNLVSFFYIGVYDICAVYGQGCLFFDQTVAAWNMFCMFPARTVFTVQDSFRPSTAAVTLALPGVDAVSCPFLSIFTVFLLLDDHVACLAATLPPLVVVTASRMLPPCSTVTLLVDSR